MMSVVFPDAAKQAHKNEKNMVLFQNQIAHFGLIRLLKIELHHFFFFSISKSTHYATSGCFRTISLSASFLYRVNKNIFR